MLRPESPKESDSLAEQTIAINRSVLSNQSSLEAHQPASGAASATGLLVSCSYSLSVAHILLTIHRSIVMSAEVTKTLHLVAQTNSMSS